MDNSEYPKPDIQDYQRFIKDANQAKQPMTMRRSVSLFKNQLLLPTAFMTLFMSSMFYCLNPIGANQRIMYEKRLSPSMRFLKRSGPLLVMMGGLIVADYKSGIWSSK